MIRQPGERTQPAAEQRHEVERRVVGPVQVLDHQHGLVGELVERGGEHGLAAAVDRRRRSVPPASRGDVAQRAERARRDQRVARAPQHAARSSPSVTEVTSAVLPMPASPITSATRPAVASDSVSAAERTLPLAISLQ